MLLFGSNKMIQGQKRIAIFRFPANPLLLIIINHHFVLHKNFYSTKKTKKKKGHNYIVKEEKD